MIVSRKILFAIIILALVLNIPRGQLAASGQIWVSTSTSYTDSIGYYRVVGEIFNDGDVSLAYNKVVATFYNKTGQVVGTDYTYAMLDVVPPGRWSPFILTLNDENQSKKVNHYSLTSTYQTTATAPQKLIILSNSTYIDNIGYKRIVGEIKNTGTITATFVKIIVTCYNGTGFVVAADYSYASTTDLAPNATSPFELSIDDERTPLVASYRLTATSHEYAAVPEYPVLFLALLPATVLLLALRKRHRNLSSMVQIVTVTYSVG